MSPSTTKDAKHALRACTECARRKGKCEIPHDTDFESLRALAYGELLVLRKNAHDTVARVSRLELLLAQALGEGTTQTHPEMSSGIESPRTPLASSSQAPFLPGHSPSPPPSILERYSALPPIPTSPGSLNTPEPSILSSLEDDATHALEFMCLGPLRPEQITTPLPLNAHDYELSAGVSKSRLAHEYTSMSWSLAKTQIARFLQVASQHTTATPAESYDTLLRVDAEFQQFLDSLPSWWNDRRPVKGMPFTYKWLSSAWVIASQHKILAVHRPYMNRKESLYQASRTRALQAARIILREAPLIGECRFWTVLYQISVAGFISLQDLFQHPQHSTSTREKQLVEITDALSVLKAASITSGIASRGYNLISRILEEGSRSRESYAVPSTAHEHSGEGNPSDEQSYITGFNESDMLGLYDTAVHWEEAERSLGGFEDFKGIDNGDMQL
ncbi:hypothetical protein P7C70_g1759, partial [Phenoliferia sp. Uapishka_3]